MEQTKATNAPALGTAPIGRLLLRLAVPTIVAQLVNLLYNLVDRIYIGHIPETGSLALTGLGLCFPIIMAVQACINLIGAGGAPRAAIAMGRGDDALAQRILGNCAALLGYAGAALTVLVLVFAQPLLRFIGASADTMPYALGYLRIYACGTLFIMFALGLNPFITTQGFSRVSMLSVIIGAACNIALDPLFIFAFDMGVEGAALATVLSQGISMVYVVGFLRGKRTRLRLQRRDMALQWAVVGPVLALGLSPFTMGITESALNLVFNTSLVKYGGDVAVGTMTILASVMQLMILPLQGLTQGAQPIIGYNFGAGHVQRVRRAFTLLLVGCLSYGLCFFLAAECFPGLFVGIFNSSDEALRALAVPALRVYLGASAIFSMQLACQQTFLALGQAKISLFIACLRKLILLIPLIYILPHVLPTSPVMAVFWAEPISDAISATTALTLFLCNFKRILKQAGPVKPNEKHGA